MSASIDIRKQLPSGRYVVGVSGGVDSMALLDIMASTPGYGVIVAHLDHGWRDDGGVDAAMVQRAAASYDLPVVTARLLLPKRDEASARNARYHALKYIAAQRSVDGIVVAHHADDNLETSVMSLLRGGDRHGAAALLAERDGLYRPLLGLSKQQLADYAQHHNLAWREDDSNRDLRYRRNWVRHEGLKQLRTQPGFDQLYQTNMQQLAANNPRIDQWLNQLVKEQTVAVEGYSLSFDRDWLRARSPRLRRHLLAAAWRRLQPGGQLRRDRVERLSLLAASDRPSAVLHLAPALNAAVSYDRVTFTRAER